MTANIEDYLNNKNAVGPNDLNNIDVSTLDIKKCKIIFENLLAWLAANPDYLTNANSQELYKQF